MYHVQNLDFNINTTSDRIDVRGSQQDLFNFGDFGMIDQNQ